MILAFQNITLYIIIGAIIFTLVIAYIGGLILSKHTFCCLKCDHRFKPKIHQVMFESHFGNKHRMKCPNCKIKSFCLDEDFK